MYKNLIELFKENEGKGAVGETYGSYDPGM